MKIFRISIGLLASVIPVFSQETDQSHQHLEILGPITTTDRPPAVAEPEVPEFAIVKSRTTRMPVMETAGSPERPAVQGIVNVTVQKVGDPGLPDPPLTPSPPPAIGTRTEELRRSHLDWSPIQLSATVHDHRRSLLRIHFKGSPEGGITAWSNIDFNHFSGFAGYRVKEPDGSTKDHRLFMGLDNIDTKRTRDLFAQRGKAYEAPEIPALPDLASAGPAFAVVEGDTTGEAMNTLVQLHDLYRKEGQRMADAFLARTKDQEERKALLLANPPEPENVKIQVWKREQPLNTQEGGSAR